MSQTTARIARRGLQQISHSRLPKQSPATPGFVARRTLTVSSRNNAVSFGSSSVRPSLGGRLNRGNVRTPALQQSEHRYWKYSPLVY
jgi:hypothetical protein